jgi:hypothetical protein
MDFSRALALLMASRGRATSMSFLLWVMLSPLASGGFHDRCSVTGRLYSVVESLSHQV